jgi:LPPG:FO 2-phospho-L-lactate transferase
VTRIAILAGGFGGAKMSHGFALLAGAGGDVAAPLEVTVIVNTGDDMELHGLHISPDLDTVMYTLAGLANTETGWGVRDETWNAADLVERYGGPTWFRLGDRDLGTHLTRTGRIRAGAALSAVTADLARSVGVTARLLPVTDDPVRTRIRTDEGWLEFQEWFVKRRHGPDAREVLFQGVESARPAPGVIESIAAAELIVLAPSNPFVSIGTILAVPGVKAALLAARAPVIAVSPIVGGRAVRGPADAMFASLGGEPSALGVARHYTDRHAALVDSLVIDWQDVGALADIESLGVATLVTSTVMRSDEDRLVLARRILDFARRRTGPEGTFVTPPRQPRQEGGGAGPGTATAGSGRPPRRRGPGLRNDAGRANGDGSAERPGGEAVSAEAAEAASTGAPSLEDQQPPADAPDASAPTDTTSAPEEAPLGD